ncbi:MAG: DegV family protein [Defluviitaleaceae bacterium]|nr:DegV family protein [Defluviitaleaceae bacterium]
MKIKILADSVCDLPENLIAKHDVRIIPLSISAGYEVFQDGINISQKEIFEFVESGKGMCRTSAVNVAEYTDIYNEERPKCDAILHFTISSEMSACYQNARLAAEEFENIHVVDTRNLSSAVGHLVLDAAEMITQGMAAPEIYEEILRRIPLLDAGFVIDTLKYLHKGGRCTAIQALASSMLKIKPCIAVQDGKMLPTKKYRGKTDSVLQSYIKDKLSTDSDSIDTRRIVVVHTMDDNNRALVDAAKAQIAEILPFDEVIEATAGGTISCHCGPNTLGIMFFRK